MSAKRKKVTAGRPPLPPGRKKLRVNVTLHESVRAKGDELAYAAGLSLSELIERLVEEEDRRKRD